MPLTISHPAATLPFTRKGFVPSALVIGSLAPDLPYFLPLFKNGDFLHSLPAIFLYCVPIGLAGLFLYQELIKIPAIELLPQNLQVRLSRYATPFSYFPLKRFLWILLSLALGAGSHVLWDAFTHAEGWVVQHLPGLQVPMMFGPFEVPFYELLQ